MIFLGEFASTLLAILLRSAGKTGEESGRPELRGFLDRVPDKHRDRLATELLLIDRHYAGWAGSITFQ